MNGQEDPAGKAVAEFVTVAEAARRLDVDPRQVRRYLSRLAPTDKGQDSQRTHKGQPLVLVRVSAVEALRRRDFEREAPKDSRNGHTKDSQRTTKDVSDAAAGAAEAQGPALVGELRARIADLSAALEHEREAHRRAETLHLGTMGELAEARRRAAMLEEQNGKLIAALPAPAEVPQETPQAPETGDNGQSGVSVGPDSAEGQRAGRAWWQIWKR